jgi:hypothetical protein
MFCPKNPNILTNGAYYLDLLPYIMKGPCIKCHWCCLHLKRLFICNVAVTDCAKLALLLRYPTEVEQAPITIRCNTGLSPHKEIIISFHCIILLHSLGYENVFLLCFLHIFTLKLQYILESGEKIICSKKVQKYKFGIACNGTIFISNLIKVWPAIHLKHAHRQT